MSRGRKWHVEMSDQKVVKVKSIESSQVFACLITKHWIVDERCREELKVAIRAKIPVVAIVLDEVNPLPFLQDAQVLLIVHAKRDDRQSQRNAFAAMVKVMNDYVSRLEAKMSRIIARAVTQKHND